MTSPVQHPLAVIPVHNEAATIAQVVRAALTYVPVIVVDDASSDGSGPLAAATGAIVLTLPYRHGKGAALRRGFVTATQEGADAIVTLDGDGQHDPQDIPRLLTASQCWPDSIIIGSRVSAASEMPRHRLHAIRVASFWISWMTGCNIADTQSGFRVYPVHILQSLRLQHGGFLLESELLLKASQAGWRIDEIPIRARYPAGCKSHYRPVRDGVAAGLYLLYCGLRFWPTQLRQLACRPRLSAGTRLEQVRHGAWVAGRATGLLPLLGLTMVAQLLMGRVGLDILAPVIHCFYDQRLLRMPLAKRNALHDHQRRQWEWI